MKIFILPAGDSWWKKPQEIIVSQEEWDKIMKLIEDSPVVEENPNEVEVEPFL